MKVLVIGASGLLGRGLYSGLGHYFDMAGTYFNQKSDNLRFLDITDDICVEKLFKKINPDIVINCAAHINSDEIERNREKGDLVNVEGTRNITMACRRFSCKLIHISSDYVFGMKSGTFLESDTCQPVNYYGETKLEAEKIIQSKLDDYIIIRPSMLYGLQEHGLKTSFVTTAIEKLSKGEKLFLDHEGKKYPVLVDDVMLLVKTLIDLDEHGIFHISSEAGLTRYEMGQGLAKEFGFSQKLIVPAKEKGRIALRPIDLKLDIRKIKHLNIHPVTFNEGMKIIRQQRGCAFKLIYSLRPDKLLLSQNTSLFRIKVGRELAKLDSVEADIVVPIPESGIYCATGYSEESKIPIHFGLIRDYYTLRTLYEPRIETRSASLRRKLIVVPEVVRHKRVILIDEALLSGSTIEATVLKLKESGVREIHVRIPSPPMIYQCDARMLRRKVHLLASDFIDKSQGVDIQKIEQNLMQRFKVNSFRFLNIEDFLNCLNEKTKMCYQCFRKDDDPHATD